MRLLLDITHPAHVHFFRNPIARLLEAGHDVKVTTRDKDCTLDLLDRFGIDYQCISKQNSGNALGMGRELLARDYELFRVARNFRPDVLAAIGGIWAAHVGWLLRKPSVVFYDTEKARLQNALTYPFATRIVVPECYEGRVPERKQTRYRGFHELSYLAPDYFQPDKEKAIDNGLDPNRDTFLIRTVSWQASHDAGLRGWTDETLVATAKLLGGRGKVIISSEGPLPDELSAMKYRGAPSEIHHLLALCRMYVGESATMASEAVVMGVPAIYAAPGFRGYIRQQENEYGMARFIQNPTAANINTACDEMMMLNRSEINLRHQRLLSECVDVNRMITEILVSRDQRLNASSGNG